MNDTDYHISLDVDLTSECALGCWIISYSALVVFILSLPFHFIYLGSIIKFSNDAYFKGPFFTLALSLGIADVGQSVVTWLFSRLFSRLLSMPALLTVSWFFLCSQVMGVVWISLDRFSAVVHPEKHASMWRRPRVIKVIVLQWVLAFAFTAPNNFIELSFHLQNTSTLRNWIPQLTLMDAREFAEVYYAMGNLLFFMIIAVVLLPVLFVFLGFKVWHHKSSEHYCCEFNNYECAMDPHEFRLAAVATCYMFLLAVTYATEFAFVLYDNNSIAFYLSYSIMFDIFNVFKPFICLALSAPARLYFQRFIRCQSALSSNRRHSRVVPHRPIEVQSSRL